jgi:hypothetical protein
MVDRLVPDFLIVPDHKVARLPANTHRGVGRRCLRQPEREKGLAFSVGGTGQATRPKTCKSIRFRQYGWLVAQPVDKESDHPMGATVVI